MSDLVSYYLENIKWKKCENILAQISEHRYRLDEKEYQIELNFLQRIGLLDQKFNTTDIGLQYYAEKFIRNDKKKADEILSALLKEYKPIRILCELLWGIKNLTKENIYRALLVYDLIDCRTTIEEITGFIMMLNSIGILSYSKKMNKVVIKYNPGTEKPERKEIAISPTTPFTNIKHLREILRNCEDYLWWFDKHFSRKGLEPLVEELDGNKVNDVRILLSINSSDNFVKLHSDYKRFKSEMEIRGINLSCKIIIDKDLINEIHGRWIMSKSFCYKVPPLNSLFMGQYDEIVKIKTRPTFNEWWNNSLDLVADWDEIQKHLPKNP